MEDKDREHDYDYLSLYQFQEDIEDGMKIPKWILRNFTERQTNEIRNTWRNELFTGKRQNHLKLYKLMTF